MTNNYYEQISEGTHTIFRSHFIRQVLSVILGSCFLAVASQIAFPLPFTPVPVTLQTLAVSLLALCQGKNKASLSVVAYLAQATCGLPVLAGGVSNPLWMMQPKAGYLLGFIAGAYLTGFLLERLEKHGLWGNLVSFASGCLAILVAGTAWLALFVGISNAVILGFVPFLIGGVLKVAMASALTKPVHWAMNRNPK